MIAAAGGGFGAYWYAMKQQEKALLSAPASIRGYADNFALSRTMGEKYQDKDGDLIADPPADTAAFVNPPKLMFTAVAADDPEKARADYKDFLTHLAKVTGKPVEYEASDEVRSPEEQLAALRDGKLHVTAFNTGMVQRAVNTAGFVPLFVPADATGGYSYQMEILVRADSPIKDPKDLKGKKLGFVAMSSNSGAKAPIFILRETFGLVPGRDYDFGFTGDHRRSVRDLLAGQFDAVCVANDILAREEEEGRVDKAAIRSIYKSEGFPPLCFGVAHNLDKGLAEKVKAAFAGFEWSGTSLGEAMKAGKKAKFVPVNYKDNWAFVRQIDESLAKMVGP
jgi:phosphonate transport system substrate-binding protein